MAEFEKQNIPTDGWLASLQIETTGQVLCGATSDLAGADKVKRKKPSLKIVSVYCFAVCGSRE